MTQSLLPCTCLAMLIGAAAIYPEQARAYDFSAVRAKYEKSIIYIHSKRIRKDGSGVAENSYGTGFVVSPEGHVMTASHVVLQEDENTTVETTGAIKSKH